MNPSTRDVTFLAAVLRELAVDVAMVKALRPYR